MVVLAFLLEDPPAQNVTLSTVISILWLGALGSGLAYVLYFYILERWGATRTTTVTYAIPVVGVTAGALLLDEQVGWRLLIIGILILGGVWLVSIGKTSGLNPVRARLRKGESGVES